MTSPVIIPSMTPASEQAGVAASLFLRLNGTRVQGSAPDAVEAMVALASGAMEEDAFAVWLRQPFQD